MTNRFAQELDIITEAIIGCAFKVGNELGTGFSEKVYENALAHKLRKSKREVKQRYGLKVKYDGVVVGDYIADLMVDECVIVELKVTKFFEPTHVAQCLSYLKTTGIKVCLLMNFGKKKVEVRRLVNHF